MSAENLKFHSVCETIATIRWKLEDVIQVLEEKGIPITDDNMDAFLKSRASKTLEERSIEEGWHILDIVVDLIDFPDKEEKE